MRELIHGVEVVHLPQGNNVRWELTPSSVLLWGIWRSMPGIEGFHRIGHLYEPPEFAQALDFARTWYKRTRAGMRDGICKVRLQEMIVPLRNGARNPKRLAPVTPKTPETPETPEAL
jgi:hypothetical protein